MRRALTPALVLLAACVTPSARAPETAPSPAPVATAEPTASVTAAELRRDLFAYAADSFMGRSAATPSGVKAARFLASRLAALGLEPAGDSGYLQRVPLSREAIGAATKFSVTTGGRTTDIPLGDLVPILSLGAGAPLPRLTAEGDIVFLGYGLTRPGRDDFANLDLRGKTVVFINSAPAGVDSVERAQLESQAGIGARFPRIIQANPAAIIVLFAGAPARQFPQIAAQLKQGSTTVGAGPDSTAARPMPLILLGVPRAGSSLVPSGWPGDDRAQSLTGRRFSARVVTERERVPAYNVAGIIRGSDPTLRNTYVAFGAHLDHVGVEAPVNGDSIANGADDDGSGTVALLAVARAMMTAPHKPRRSSLFVWHTAEELGLLGSEYFTQNATVPLDSIVAQLNADMIGRNSPDSLYLVGPLAAPKGQSAVLGGLVDSVNSGMSQPFTINREWDSPSHPEQIYYRSDHYSYAKHGVPIVFFTTGLHDDYHKVSDEPDKIDYDKLARVAELMRLSGIAVGNRVSRPAPTEAVP
ncbi:MAG: M20/M25/M40 family metallo-hydrolase [Gemmatimonadaceae bacterium]